MYEFKERVRYSETDENEQATILSVVNRRPSARNETRMAAELLGHLH